MPFRELYWNISSHWVIYPLFAPFAVAFVYGCYRVLQLVRVGQPDAGGAPLLARIDRKSTRLNSSHT